MRILDAAWNGARRGICSPLLTTFLMISLLPAATLAQSKKEIQVDQQKLRSLAQELLRSRVEVVAPSFTIKDNTLYYYLGDIQLPEIVPITTAYSSTIPGDNPLRLPLKDQLRIEALKQYISANEDRLAFLSQGLEAGENLVSQALKDIFNNTGDRDALLDRLEERGAEVIRAIDKTVQDYAIQKGLNLYKTSRKALAATKEVFFTSTPDGAVISYTLEFDYLAAKKAGKNPSWRLAAQAKTTLLDAGAYRIWVVWPDPQKTGGIKESEYTIDILNNGQLNVKPLSKQP